MEVTKKVYVSNKLKLVACISVDDIEVLRQRKVFILSIGDEVKPPSSDIIEILRYLKDHKLAKLIEEVFELSNFTKGDLSKLLPNFEIIYTI